MNILAGSEQRLRWTGTDFEPAADGDWVIRSLNYWQAQECIRAGDDLAQIQATLRAGLVSVPGVESVADWIAAPQMAYPLPLFTAIWAHSRGN